MNSNNSMKKQVSVTNKQYIIMHCNKGKINY
jgi:hypothetical protein